MRFKVYALIKECFSLRVLEDVDCMVQSAVHSQDA